MSVYTVMKWIIRFVILSVLFIIIYVAGAQAVAGILPDIPSEPGLVSPEIGILIIGAVNTLIIMALVLSSRWSGWKLILSLSIAFYGAVTFIMQIETWFFLSDITVGEQLLPRLFLMGMPVAFLFIPIAVWLLGKGGRSFNYGTNTALVMPVKQWVIKVVVIVLAYITLYWCAGYFIAWQNPELRAFYGSPGEIVPFWTHTLNTLRSDPGLFLFQILRALLWTLFALPVIRGSKMNVFWTALLVGVLFSIPQNIGHILENPLLPLMSVRLSHMIETASSNFVFGFIVAWLLYREHRSVSDLFRMKNRYTYIWR